MLHAASNYANAVIALALRDATRLPVVYEVRGFWEDTWLSRHAGTRDLKLSDRYLRTRALETHCMRSADLVVTLGEAMRDEIIERGVDPGKVIIVPNGVSEEFLQPLPDDNGQLKASLGIQPGEHVVGLVSSLVAHEGIGTLLEAVKILDDRGVRTRALIVGDGPERAALQRQAQALGIDAIFPGRVPMSQVRAYHAVLDVFVVPRTPGPGLPARHAAQAGGGDGQRPARRGQRGQGAQRDRQRQDDRAAVAAAGRGRARGHPPGAARQTGACAPRWAPTPASGSPATAPGRTTPRGTVRRTSASARCNARQAVWVRALTEASAAESTGPGQAAATLLLKVSASRRSVS